MKKSSKVFVHTSLGYMRARKTDVEFFLFKDRKESEPVTSELDDEGRFWLEGRPR
jgi:hypothetical protein